MRIKVLVMDVDGTLTDGKIYVGAKGELMKAFHVRDGYAIAHLLPGLGILPVIITGRKSEIVAQRAMELGIQEVYQGVSNKLTKLKELAGQLSIMQEEIAYIGDDVNDLDCITYCTVTGCPQDAVDAVKSKVDFVCNNCGGQGAVREFIEWLSDSEENR